MKTPELASNDSGTEGGSDATASTSREPAKERSQNALRWKKWWLKHREEYNESRRVSAKRAKKKATSTAQPTRQSKRQKVEKDSSATAPTQCVVSAKASAPPSPTTNYVEKRICDKVVMNEPADNTSKVWSAPPVSTRPATPVGAFSPDVIPSLEMLQQISRGQTPPSAPSMVFFPPNQVTPSSLSQMQMVRPFAWFPGTYPTCQANPLPHVPLQTLPWLRPLQFQQPMPSFRGY